MIVKGRCREILFCVSILLCLMMLGSCITPTKGYKPVTLERTSAADMQNSGEGAGVGAAASARQPSIEELKLPTFEKMVPEKKLPPSQPIDARRLTMVDQPVTLNAERMPLSDFIIYALGETLKVAFVMDEKMMNNKKPMTIRMPQPMPPDRALNVIMGMLEKEGIYLEERAGALYVLQVPPEPRSLVDIRVGTDAVNSFAEILQIVPLRHIRSSDVEPLIKDLFKSGIQVKPYSRENVMILYGRAAQMKPILDLINKFDVPYLQDRKIFFMRLTYWQTDEFITQLTKIMEGLGFTVAKTPKEPGPLLMPVKQLNAILVIAPDEHTAKYIQEWKEKLDTPEAAGTEFKTYTFSPRYSRASDLVESVQKLYGGTATTVDSKTAQPLAQRGLVAKAAGIKESAFEAVGMKMSADDRKNIIIILSKPDAYRNLLNLFQTLDVPARQVLIEATIVELSLVDDLQYGVEWFVKTSPPGDSFSLGTLGRLGVGDITGGLTYSFLSKTGKYEALIRAMAEANKANILSTPRLMVLDNMEATIQVGEDVPTVTGQITTAEATTTTATSVSQSIQYRSTGVILKVKPTINTEGMLTLEISQEVSLISDTPGVGNSPIIRIRKINTSIVAAHGQTIVLGGLMKENVSVTESKVPLLGDIPILGHLFKSTSRNKDKTELLVLVTPTILTNSDDAVKVSDQLRNELKWLK